MAAPLCTVVPPLPRSLLMTWLPSERRTGPTLVSADSGGCTTWPSAASTVATR